MKYDFEFWAATSVTIEKKVTPTSPDSGYVHLVLNRPQRILLKELEAMRLAGVPIRLILLKARQYGGSTLIQLYGAWIQLFHRTNWHFLIAADEKGKAQRIRGMYHTMVKYHPQDVIDGIDKLSLVPYEGTQNNKIIRGRECIIGVTSTETPQGPRSYALHMVHASEVGLWKSTAEVNAEKLMSALLGSVPHAAYTMIVKESTGNGVGNYFHKAWLAAKSGQSLDVPVFISWYEDPNDYNIEVKNKEEFIESWNSYENFLWSVGATIEHIAWYRAKRKEYPAHWMMQAEYPTTPEEAFQSTGSRIFDAEIVQEARKNCLEPVSRGILISSTQAQKGKDTLQGLTFREKQRGSLLIWSYPGKKGVEKKGKIYKNRYCAFLDTGGRNPKADYYCLTILDRIMTLYGGIPEIAAEWHVHMDADLAAWEAVRICKWYEDAYLGIEVNRLHLDHKEEGKEPEQGIAIIEEIKDVYENLYYRIKPEQIKEHWDGVIGFWTGKETKQMLIKDLTASLRDRGYLERNHEACNEFDTYELKENGTMGAILGSKDDRVISRAGALWLSNQMDCVVECDKTNEIFSVTER